MGERNKGSSDGGRGERNQTSNGEGGGGDKNQFVSSGQKENTFTINEINFGKMFSAMHHLSQINKVFILPQPFNQTFYNIYKFMYI